MKTQQRVLGTAQGLFELRNLVGGVSPCDRMLYRVANPGVRITKKFYGEQIRLRKGSKLFFGAEVQDAIDGAAVSRFGRAAVDNVESAVRAHCEMPGAEPRRLRLDEIRIVRVTGRDESSLTES